ncbi:Hypothetical protein PHPALM_36559 [Phytophthora palmivora]|uniref:Ubiquitin-like protease family profile domain-containing protein n=1 Tax=Phytophthora palmivora TaxID=4796 RepID=A0A2P4WZN1_9STRA|nr:Hypothetical protein PHPALM_36559 [Phytophthora palmivora]
MDERGCQLWLEKVWKPKVASHTTSFLMLDEFKCHSVSECKTKPQQTSCLDCGIYVVHYMDNISVVIAKLKPSPIAGNIATWTCVFNSP